MMLRRDEVQRGLEAVYQALGQHKGRAFLEMVAAGALDPSLVNQVQAWLRRHPELVAAGASLLGGVLASLALEPPVAKVRAADLLSLVRAVATQSPQAEPPAEPPARVIDVTAE